MEQLVDTSVLDGFPRDNKTVCLSLVIRAQTRLFNSAFKLFISCLQLFICLIWSKSYLSLSYIPSVT